MTTVSPRRVTIGRAWDGTTAGADEIVRLEFGCDAAGLALEVDAPFHGDPAPQTPAGRCDRLWEHEVVELFLVGAGERYLEIELGPHGHYLALVLEGVRRVVQPNVEVCFSAAIDAGRWRGAARVAASYVPEALERWNAFAVHGASATRRHLAAHPIPGAAPDFHRIDRFPAL